MIDTDTTRLLDHLHRGGAYGYWWALEGRESIWWKIGQPKPLPSGRRNIYYGVHPTGALPETNRRGEQADLRAMRAQLPIISAINCFFAEYDAKDFGDNKDRAHDLVEALDPPPSVVVDSGGGFHAYWLLDEPWALTSAKERDRASKLQAAWVALMDGDPQSKDLARVLRVPGTCNYKYIPPRQVVFIQTNFDRLYHIAKLAAHAQPFLESDLPPQTNGAAPAAAATAYGTAALRGEAAKVRSVADGLKHGQLLRSAIALGGLIETGTVTEQEITEMLEAAVRGRAKDFKNAQDTIRDGIAYGKARPRKITLREEHTNGQEPAAKSTAETKTPPARRSETIVAALTKLGYIFRLNLCSDTVEVNGVAIDDIQEATILTEMRDQDFKGRTAIKDAWTAEAARHAYHPIRDYLNGCSWDGSPHIERLAAYLTCKDAPVGYADGSSVALSTVYLWRWLIGAVAKIFDQAQNLMLVLAGPQGIGKSQFVRWLCSGIPQLFIEAPITVGDRDTDVRLMTRFIWEVSELDATTRKADVSALKAFITKQTVTARKAYGHHDTVKPACASLIGTVNESGGFLADETGNRRFYVTTLSGIDWSYAALDVNQIWGQAVSLYRNGEPWQLQPDEATAQGATNRQHEVDSPLEDWIERYFYLGAGDDSGMSAAEIIDHLRAHYEIRLGGSERAQAMEIARVMARFGIQKRQRIGRGVREYIGLMPKNA